jgi:4-hydroxybenzoate polyprenyltransferase
VKALLRASHLQPALAVTAMTTALAVRAGRGWGAIWVALAMLSGQAFVGWSNDWLDRDRDRAAGRTDKPVAAGAVGSRAVGFAAVGAVLLCVPLSLANGLLAGAVHLGAVASAGAYNAWLKRTLASWLPYAVSFLSLPYFVSFGLPGHPAPPWWMPVAAALLGVGAHFVNTLPDQADDVRLGVRGLPQRIGRTPSLVCGAVLLVAAGALLAVAPRGSSGGALLLLGAQVAAVAGVVFCAVVRRDRAAWSLTILSALLAVALLLVQGGRIS